MTRLKIGRTQRGKPYLMNKDVPNLQHYPNWNYNVSHQGGMVAIAAEPVNIVGLDLMMLTEDRDRGRKPEESLSTLKDQFTSVEYKQIQKGIEQGEMEGWTEFYRHWCAKESYIKALGIGLGFEPKRIGFSYSTPGQLELRGEVDGKHASEWSFNLSMIDSDHVACIARGTVEDTIEEYRSTLSSSTLNLDTHRKGLTLPQPKWTLLSFADLVPYSRKSEYYTLPKVSSKVLEKGKGATGGRV